VSEFGAKTTVRFEFGAELEGADGYRARFTIDDSFRSWLAIARWNLHYRHWGALRQNGGDLFTRVLWRKLWPPTS
jgi:hypothetical protein